MSLDRAVHVSPIIPLWTKKVLISIFSDYGQVYDIILVQSNLNAQKINTSAVVIFYDSRSVDNLLQNKLGEFDILLYFTKITRLPSQNLKDYGQVYDIILVQSNLNAQKINTSAVVIFYDSRSVDNLLQNKLGEFDILLYFTKITRLPSQNLKNLQIKNLKIVIYDSLFITSVINIGKMFYEVPDVKSIFFGYNSYKSACVLVFYDSRKATQYYEVLRNNNNMLIFLADQSKCIRVLQQVNNQNRAFNSIRANLIDQNYSKLNEVIPQQKESFDEPISDFYKPEYIYNNYIKPPEYFGDKDRGNTVDSGLSGLTVNNLDTFGASDVPEHLQFDVNKVEAGLDTRTMLMVRNIPNRYTKRQFIEWAMEFGKGYFDFLYLRIDWSTKRNSGFGFIHFTDLKSLVCFVKLYGMKKWQLHDSKKRCLFAYGEEQNLSRLIQRFSSQGMKTGIWEYQPSSFYTGGENAGLEIVPYWALGHIEHLE
ncbi:hypothetical protein BB561_006819 [Smittium simulii]|uniref:Mei2-like C-terminal RNA recognition motif domain-containing protein n=1 Tax=Smittium simulii TaxID=133385 RepID=A0A2T9Y159_9FUNG|nr:hypothetical protein BB561_006819 [Smittium simulii]